MKYNHLILSAGSSESRIYFQLMCLHNLSGNLIQGSNERDCQSMALKLIGQFRGDGISEAGIKFNKSDWLIESTYCDLPSL